MTVSVEKELENQLMEAGNRLLNPPSSAKELVSLLDQVETYLSRVDQSPSESMQTALDPLKKALVANDLLTHSDMDVKVAAASCISEITRITAPNAPYGDDQMKDIFHLIVGTFENLFDMSSCSFPRRVSILETVAKVRSCVVMLDLECDALIYVMFQHFLKAIRDDHPANVFTSIETIMTLVLEESEDISLELISLLLTSVKMENVDVLPVARKLGEKVLENCAVKLKPYLMQAVLSMGLCMDDYSKIVATICQEAFGTIDQNNVSASGEQLADGDKLLEKIGSDETPQVVEEMMPGATSREHDVGVDVSQTSLTSNGSAENGDDGLQKSPDSSNSKLEQSMKTDIDNSVGKIIKSKTKQDLPAKKIGGKTNCANAADVLNNSHGETDKEAVELPDHSKGHREKANNIISEGQLGNETMLPTVHEKVTGLFSSLTDSQSEAIDSALEGNSLSDGIHPKRGRKLKKENTKQDTQSALPSVGVALSSNQVGDEVPPSADSISKNPPEAKCDSEAKQRNQPDMKEGARGDKYDTPPSVKVISEKSPGKVNNLEEKPVKKSGKKITNNDKQPVNKEESRTKSVGGKPIEKKNVTGESTGKKKVSSADSITKSSNKDDLDETPKTNSKRKRASETKETSRKQELKKEYGEDLVGSKIEVWWPMDQMFYGGVIDSFDPVRKTHKVFYFDGDVEILHLEKERWAVIESDGTSDDAQESDQASPNSSAMRPQIKKVKNDSNSSSKRAKPSSSLRRVKGNSSGKGKSKRDVSRSGGNSKLDGKSKVEISGKRKTEGEKSGGKSDNDRLTSKNVQKSTVNLKDSSPKSSSKSKGDTSVSGSKSGANDDANSKGKSSATKMQGSSERLEKGKVTDSVKSVGSGTKSGKKRQRGFNG